MSSAITFDHFHDIDAQAEQLLGFDQHYQQLDAGPYAGAFLTCQIGSVVVSVEWTNRTLYQQGAGAHGVISAVLLLREGRCRASRLNGDPLTTDHIVLLGEGTPFDATLEAGAVPVVVSISATEGCANALIKGRASCIVAPDLATRFRSLAKGAANGERSVVTEISSTNLMALALSSPSERRRNIDIFREASSALVGDQATQQSVASVARSVGVSRRTLDKVFKANVGVTPGRFRKVSRLNRARRLIENGQHSVTTAAGLSGLHHLGRFFQDYNELFGELPSVALKRARRTRTTRD